MRPQQTLHPAGRRIVSKSGVRVVTAMAVIATLLVSLFGLLDALADHSTPYAGKLPVSKAPLKNDHGGPDRGADRTEPRMG